MALKLGEVQIFSLDPFADISPLTEPLTITSVGQRIVYEKEFASMGLLTGNDGTSRSNDNYDDEWIMEGDLHCTRNIFDIFMTRMRICKRLYDIIFQPKYVIAYSLILQFSSSFDYSQY